MEKDTLLSDITDMYINIITMQRSWSPPTPKKNCLLYENVIRDISFL